MLVTWISPFLLLALNSLRSDGHHSISEELDPLEYLGKSWWSQGGSNSRPPACHAGALPAELRPHTKVIKRLEYCCCDLIEAYYRHLSMDCKPLDQTYLNFFHRTPFRLRQTANGNATSRYLSLVSDACPEIPAHEYFSWKC